jgi:hypothetical protein
MSLLSMAGLANPLIWTNMYLPTTIDVVFAMLIAEMNVAPFFPPETIL